MRRIRYQVACSLDGYIAGPNGEFDWIPNEPEIDFAALFAEFDTLLMGRKTYEILPLDDPTYGHLYADKRLIVVSRTLRPENHQRVTVISALTPGALEHVRIQAGKDLWRFGGGELVRALLELGYVDTVELASGPIVLGGGIPFRPPPAPRRRLRLLAQRHYAQSGSVLLTYAIESQAALAWDHYL